MFIISCPTPSNRCIIVLLDSIPSFPASGCLMLCIPNEVLVVVVEFVTHSKCFTLKGIPMLGKNRGNELTRRCLTSVVHTYTPSRSSTNYGNWLKPQFLPLLESELFLHMRKTLLSKLHQMESDRDLSHIANHFPNAIVEGKLRKSILLPVIHCTSKGFTIPILH